MQMHNRDLDNKPFHQPRIKLETLDESYDDFEFPSYIPMEDYDDPDYMDVKPPKVDDFYINLNFPSKRAFSFDARVFFRCTLIDSIANTALSSNKSFELFQQVFFTTWAFAEALAFENTNRNITKETCL